MTIKPISIYQAIDLIAKILTQFFNSPDDKVFLRIQNDYISGYVISDKVVGLDENRKQILLKNLFRNYSYEFEYLSPDFQLKDRTK